MVPVLRQYGYSLIFLAVFAESLGLPVPSYPLMLVGTALAADLHFRWGGVLAVSVVAALAAGQIWYVLGRLRGRPILRKLCSLSLCPDSCVSRMENLFLRHGLKSLLFAKFVPGLNTVGAPLAGMLKTSPLRFTLFDLGGTIAWAGSAVLLGLAFRSQVEWAIAWLTAFGRTSVLVMLILLGGWLLWKWVERRRFYRLLAKARISSAELKERLDRGDDVIVLDLRSGLSYEAAGAKIPGALRIPPEEFMRRYLQIPPNRPVVMYCS